MILFQNVYVKLYPQTFSYYASYPIKCINVLLVLREKCQMNSFYRKICIEITIKRWNTLSVQYFVTFSAPEIIIVTIKAFGRTYRS